MRRGSGVWVALWALANLACPGPPPGEEDKDASVGCVGFGCSDGGTLPDGGAPQVSITQARRLADGGEHVRVEGRIHTLWSRQPDPLGGGDLRAELWIADPAAPEHGLWVQKEYTDLYRTMPSSPLREGDWVRLDGYLGRVPAGVDVSGHRVVIRNQQGFVVSNYKPLTIERLDGGVAPPHYPVDAGEFGDAAGGREAANPELAGARVHVRGPLELTDPTPDALVRYRFGQVVGYAGFEVSGGILVSDLKTASLDGGFGYPGRCDWRRLAESGERVVFENGVFGVWDSYTHAPCTDGGTLLDGGMACLPARGFIPGTDAGFTYVLYPQDCGDDLDGGVVP